MFQVCFGSYIVLSLFTFLFIWGALAKARRLEEGKIQKAEQEKEMKEWANLVNLRLNS